MFNDLQILVSGDYNAFDNGFKGTGIYAVSGLQPTFVEIPIYVGSSIELERRIPRGHIYELGQNQHGNRLLQTYFNNHGIENMVFFLLEKWDNEETLFDAEQKYIDYYGTIRTKKSFNICEKAGTVRGAALGHKWTDEQKKVASMRMTENNPFSGKKHTDSTKKKLSEFRKSFKISEETRAAQSKAQLGRKHPEEVRRKIAEGNTGKRRSDEAKKKISLKNAESFSVLDKNSGFVYDFTNLREFCRERKISMANFLATRYQKRRKHCKGLVLMEKGF